MPTNQPSRLSQLALVCLEGEAAVDFLQNYTTADITPANSERLQIAACCNRQGRVVADVDVIQGRARCYLVLHQDAVKPLAEHLAGFLAFAKVTWHRGSKWQGYCLHVHKAAAECTPPPGHCYIRGERLWLRYAYAPDFLVCWQRTTQDEGVQAVAGVDAALWYHTEMRASRARVTSRVSEAFLPQALGYDRLGALSYDKGCYLGQEIVARTYYQGALKTKLALLSCAATRPSAGDIIVDHNGAKLGTAINSAACAKNGNILLAVIRTNSDLSAAHLERSTAAVRNYAA